MGGVDANAILLFHHSTLCCMIPVRRVQDLINRVKVNTRRPSTVFRNTMKLSRGEYVASEQVKSIYAACLVA